MVKIITDSCCDLDKGVADGYGITIVPLGVTIGEDQYFDRVDLDPDDLYSMMRSGAAPKTFQVSPGLFREAFDRFEGEEILCLCFSSKLSGTYQSAVMAAEDGGDIEIIDTRAASMGHGLLVLHAATMAMSGASRQEIATEIRTRAEKLEHIFSVDSLTYLHRGGRISQTKAIIGSVLSIKPILHFVDGAIFPLENTRSRKKAFSRMVDIAEERGVGIPDQIIGISHAGDPEGAEELKELLMRRIGFRDCIVTRIGSAIVSHAGPGTIALFFLGTKQGGNR